jgi:hypothetical protein
MITNYPSKLFVRRLRAVWLVLACLALAGVTAPAEAALPEPDLERLSSSPKMSPALVAALERAGKAYVSITFSLPSREDPLYAGHPAWGTDVNPLIFDLVSMAVSADLRLEDLGSVQTFTGAMNAKSLLILLDNPHILAIGAARRPRPQTSGAPQPVLKAACVPSSSTACLQGGRFSASVTHGGNTSQVSSATSESAVFWTFSSTNLEILVKVLNGCGANGRYWVFAAGATSLSHDVTIEDHVKGIIVRYPNASCPLTDTSTFIC